MYALQGIVCSGRSAYLPSSEWACSIAGAPGSIPQIAQYCSFQALDLLVCLNELVNSPQPEAWQCPVVQQIAMPLSPLVLDFMSWADHLLLQAFVQCSHHFCCHCFNCWFESCDLWHCHLAILCKLAKPTLFEELPFAVSISRGHTLILQKLSFSMSSTLLTAKWHSSASFFSTAARTAAGFFLLRCFQSLEWDLLFSLP